MSWCYQPITIHAELSNQFVALSGAYLFNTQTFNYHFITIVDVEHPDKYSYKFTSSQLISTTSITWISLTPCDVKFLYEESSTKSYPLLDFINGLQSNDRFQFKPNNSQYLSIVCFRLSPQLDNSTLPLFDKSQLSPIIFQNPQDVLIPSKISIQCCPFSLTNAAIFSNYRIFGSINYSINDTGYLSDIKYLDDIIGGVVSLDQSLSKSIGLVGGSLSKKNGDGELLLIISWNKIFQLLNYRDLTTMNNNSLIQNHQVSSKFDDPINSIVRISVSTNEGNYWGSGIILTDRYIVTNEHVLKLNLLKDFQITLSNGGSLHLNDFDIIESPLIGFDLCFLKLKSTSSQQLPSTATLHNSNDSITTGEISKSIGFGLMFSQNSSDLKPFHSEGFINSIVSLDLQDTGTLEKTLLISSASCWNGSSGGGLFNKSNQLIGIMTSNGKLSNGEILTNFTLAIPMNIIQKCLFMIENNLDKVDLTEKIHGLWSLKNTHNHVNLELQNKL